MLMNKIIKAVHYVEKYSTSFLRKSGVIAALYVLSLTHNANAIPEQYPLFLAHTAVPIMMLNMSKDHQLYFKVYDDYSDLTDTHKFLTDGVTPNPDYLGTVGDGIPETTYVHGYQYYGYFDSKKCYDYSTSNSRFEPAGATGADGYCSGKWSGNFLNWATMTRMDVIRKILYGGLRSTDTSTDTVLERAFLPNDAHAFAKYYNGTDINKLTPFNPPAGLTLTEATGITLCNVSSETSGYSQDSTSAPLIRVVKGNYSLWASSERWQCRWGTGSSGANTLGYNGNDPAKTLIQAYDAAPLSTSTNKLSVSGLTNAGEYVVRVKVCTSAATAEENCQKYPSASYANKPTGVLQKYGETSELDFGLITGSYNRNKSGGVLRKNAGNMLDEINTTDWGTFKTPPATGGIINSLNLLRLYGYSFSSGDAGSYGNGDPGDSCTYAQYEYPEGNCSNWGNPQSEIYYESLRYLAGVGATSSYSNGSNPDTNYINNLKQATWSPPVTTAKGNYCAPLSVLQFNASSNSYDVDLESSYPALTDLNLTNIAAVNALTDSVGTSEGITGTQRFVGKIIGGNTNQLCTAKVVDKLSNVSGICPDSPRLDGGYAMVGLAKYARKTGIPLKNVTPATTSKVRTYGVALAPAVPKVEVLVPGTGAGTGVAAKTVIIQPACRNNTTGLNGGKNTNCAIVDFKIVSAVPSGSTVPWAPGIGASGSLYVSWEDSEQGGDYDQDMWGLINYFVTPTKVYIRTQVLAQSSKSSLGFGYILSGTDGDGFNVHSGILNFTYGTSCSNAPGNRCTCRLNTSNDALFAECDGGSAADKAEVGARMKTYNVAGSAASFLKSPLYYAAKWGGYDNDFATNNATNLDAAIANRTPSDSFFYATHPHALADQLDTAFLTISNDKGVASGVATNNSFLKEGTFLFRSEFNSFDWTGVLRAYAYDNNGNLNPDPVFSTSDGSRMPTSGSGRTVLTYNGATTPAIPVSFSWGNLTTAQQTALKLSGESTTDNAKKRANWLLGNATDETKTSGLRVRTPTSGNRNILGDLVNSSPIYVGANNYNYRNLPTGGSTYEAYVARKATKTPRIYVGGNDGMVHAFNASNDSNVILKEMYAYIPNIAFPKLANLTRPDYGKSSNPHQYVVDGPIAAGDVYINGMWRTIIVGTLGAGGRGVYALEVMQDQAADQVKVLFELNETNYPQLGYVMGAPSIVPMANGRWAAIFGNGDSSTKTSQLFIIDIEAPFTNSKVIDTGTGTGLSAPVILSDAVGRATAAYAGDLSGNLWKFDLSDPNSTNWKTDYLLFKATDKDVGGNPQPIFAAPTLGVNSQKNNVTMVYFGTGKYYDAADNTASAVPQHSYYAIADIGKTATSPSVLRNSLKPKTMTTTYNGSASTRVVNEVNPDWKTQNGWYLNLGGIAGSDLGERVTTTAVLVRDKLIFPTLIASPSPCDNGGKSWLMEVVAIGDKYVNKKELENNKLIEGVMLGDLDIGRANDGKIEGTSSKGDPIVEPVPLPVNDLIRRSWRQLQ